MSAAKTSGLSKALEGRERQKQKRMKRSSHRVTRAVFRKRAFFEREMAMAFQALALEVRALREEIKVLKTSQGSVPEVLPESKVSMERDREMRITLAKKRVEETGGNWLSPEEKALDRERRYAEFEAEAAVTRAIKEKKVEEEERRVALLRANQEEIIIYNFHGVCVSRDEYYDLIDRAIEYADRCGLSEPDYEIGRSWFERDGRFYCSDLRC